MTLAFMCGSGHRLAGSAELPPRCDGRGPFAGFGSLLVCGVVLHGAQLFAQAPARAPSIAERLGSAAAAVTILTSEYIRRSGATTIPDALRLVPGIHVARQTSSTWAVSARGFSSVNSEKLLVLSDTRSVYTPLFSGVLCDVHDYLLFDIDRIEVIRGPGASLWGSNAVNGVISITTKSARDTQGGYVETAAGTEERVAAAARYGGRLGDRAYYRVFGKYVDRGATNHASLQSSDEWRTGHGGFRADWEATTRDTVTVQGDAYGGRVGELAPAIVVIGRPGPEGRLRVGVSGGNLLARWRHTRSQGSDVQVRVYYDRTHRDDPSFVDDLHTLDLDLQHRVGGAARHELTWGASYRHTANRNVGKIIFNLEPASSRDNVISGFIQDQVELLPSVRLTVGTKVEHNDFSGAELQPGVRAAWDLAPGQTLWGAVSRAVRVPTRLERDIAIDVLDPLENPGIRLLGNPSFGSERLLAYESGYRWQPVPTLSFDTAVFHNRYTGLASLELGDVFQDPRDGRTIIPLQNENLTKGRARGIEALVAFAPGAAAQLTGSYSFLDLALTPGGEDHNRGRFLAGSTPRHQLGLRGWIDLPARIRLDAQFRRLSAIRQLPTIITGEGLPGYHELDVRVAWIGPGGVEYSIVGQNLLHRHHVEFGAPEARGAIERGVYGKVAWTF